MKLSLPKIIALMAALIASTLLLTSRGCSMTDLATSQKTKMASQPGSTGDNTLTSPSAPRGGTDTRGDYKTHAVTAWDSHNLSVLGENFIPVGDAFSTPFATFFRIDENGYIPSAPLGPVNTDGPCQKKWYPRDRAGGIGVVEDKAVDAATIGASSNNTAPECPRDLGNNLEAGSYLFDKNGNDLAGFEFKTNPHLYEIIDNQGKKYLVFPEGGKGPADNPAMKKMKLETLLVDASAYPIGHDHDEAMAEIQNLIPGNKGAKIKYLPVKSADESQQDAEDALVAAVQREIDALIKRLENEERGAQPTMPDSLFIGVRMQNYSTEELAEQQRRIKAKVKKVLDEMQAKINRKLIVMHFGSELPACAVALTACRAMNTSVAIYSRTR